MVSSSKGVFMNDKQLQFLKELSYYTDNLLNDLQKKPSDLYGLLNYKDAEVFEWLEQKSTLKTYTLIKTRKDHTSEITGDMPYLLKTGLL